MALINSWLSRPTRAEPTRTGLVICDVCVPPRCWPGTPASLRDGGWAFTDFERGPHWCPTCTATGRVGDTTTFMLARPSQRPALPNFLILGAAKCGTTSLHRYLDTHPEISMSQVKELNFFIDPNCGKHLERYRLFFDGDAPVRGESSPYYLCAPLAPGVPERIAATIPDCKLLVMVRDPIERLLSHYVDDYAGNRESRPFEVAVVDELDDPFNRYISPGRYAEQVGLFTSRFDDSRIMVVDHRELLAERLATLSRIFKFLGVDEHWSSRDFTQMANTGTSKRRAGPLFRATRRMRVGRRVRSLPIPEATAARLIASGQRLLKQPVRAPRVGEADLARLRAVYRPEAAAVKRLRC